jgi:hypothetical protein
MVSQRMNKLKEELHTSMSISPFLLPILFDLHHASSFAELGSLLLAGHLMVGHFTSFGKLIDEKILPRTFNTAKLDAKYRQAHPPLIESCFNEIDHLVPRDNGVPVLLSLKSSRWTIQLTAAKELNSAFGKILSGHGDLYNEVVVGVFNGRQDTLTDKYDILRGINRGKVHDVIDLTKNVHVYAGREFWSWLNQGEYRTQEWVLDGIIAGLAEANCREECRELLTSYADAFNKGYEDHLKEDMSVDWHRILGDVNG